MFCNIICALFFWGSSSLYASESRQIILHTLNWSGMFCAHVANDPGCQHFTYPINKPPDIILSTFGTFDGTNICHTLSNLHCATCFAMTINPHVGEDIFTKALADCHVSEIYQVFVAADSYYKGIGDSKKLQTLKHHLPEDLLNKGALLANQPFLAKTALKYQSSVFERELTWLQTWENSWEELHTFFKFDQFVPPTKIFSGLMRLCDKCPYTLHHLDISDFQKYAHTLIPALLKEDNLYDLADRMFFAFSGDPQKKVMLTLLSELSRLLPEFEPPPPHAEKSHCTYCVGIIWTLFKALNAHVTQKQWSRCVTCMRQSLPWLDEVFKHNHPWLTTVFAHKELPQKALSSTTAFDYYTQHHAPYIFKIYGRIVSTLYDQLEQYFPHDKKQDFKDWLFLVRSHNTGNQYNLFKRYIAIEQFHILRFSILWNLAKKETPSLDFLYLHSVCSQAEKKALCLNAQWLMVEGTVGKKILTDVRLPDPLKDLSRIRIPSSITIHCAEAPQS